MSYTWTPPLHEQYKVNVHIVTSSRQLNGNFNGIGIIIRDHRGRLVKAVSGTIKGLSNMATQLWAIHMGINQARLANCELLTVETDNYAPYHEVVRKDGRGDKNCLWIVEQIKKLLGYNPEWHNRFRIIPETSNRAANYLALVGLNNWTCMHLIFEPFGRLQEKMDLDMGFGPPIPQLQLLPIPRDALGYVQGFAPSGQVFPANRILSVPDFQSENGSGDAA